MAGGAPAAQRAALDSAEVFALREAVARAGEAFADCRARAGTPGLPWDAVVLTCATESQAAAAQEELARRRRLALFPPGCLLLALADPPRRRVGSGGATLLALETLAHTWWQRPCAAHAAGTGEPGSEIAAPFRHRRVLLIHSGGESQRLPAYAALGKIFVPLPVLLPETPDAAIFDWLYLLASATPGGAGEVVLLCGDALPVYNPFHLPALAGYPVRGVAIRQPAETGERFGVYVPGKHGAAARILQKPSREAMAAAGAVDAAGQTAVDTGMLTLRYPAVRQLLMAAGLSVHEGTVTRTGSALLPQGGGAAAWDLYRDWLPRLAGEAQDVVTSLPAGTGEDAEVVGRAGRPHTGWEPAPLSEAVESALARAAAGLSAGVAVPLVGAFVHLGTSREFHDALAERSPLRTLFPFAAQRDSAVEDGAVVGGAFVGRSLLGKAVRLAPGAAVDHCRAEGALELGAGAMASGVAVAAGDTLRVAPGRLCFQTLLRAADGALRRVTATLGLDDNPKLPAAEATLHGARLVDWLAVRGLDETAVWPDAGPHTVWEAKLFVSDDADAGRAIHEWLQQPPAGGGVSAAAVRDRWRRARRYSLHDLLDAADAGAVAQWRGQLLEDVVAARIVADVQAGGDTNFGPLIASLGPEQRRAVLAMLTKRAADEGRTPAALQRARYWRVAADLAGAGAAGEDRAKPYLDWAAGAVREAVGRPGGGAGEASFAHAPGWRVRVAAPVRIDLGGGWTDTPPFSLERGGAVVNASLLLDGELPVFVEVEILDEPRLILESEDLATAVEVATAHDAAGYDDPADPFALAKACCVLAGLIEPASRRPLAPLVAAGRGVRVRTGARVARGSGLGTSSIMGAALLQALGEVAGRPPSDAVLSRQTLALEQVMTTGGGWQDQMGAIAPGVKLISTEPGPDQRPQVQPLAADAARRAALEAHLVVGYSGQRRLAKDILRQVVLRYLGREPLAMQALAQLQRVAGQIARAVEALDLELLGTLVTQAWLLNKTLDPHTSYPAVERLFSALAPHVFGAKLVGAGGGGFFVAITRRPHQQAVIADLMARDREFAYGYVVSHRVWDGGLRCVTIGHRR